MDLKDFRRRAANLAKERGTFHEGEQSFLKAMIMLPVGVEPSMKQMEWLLRLSKRAMKAQCREDEIKGVYQGKLKSIIGGGMCAECSEPIPKERAESNFCSINCLHGVKT